MNEFAKEILEDGQSLRPFYNYLSDTFDAVKQKKLSFEGVVFTDRIEFYKHIKQCLDFMIESAEEWKLDEPKEYEKRNE